MVTALANCTLPEFVRGLAERLDLGAAHVDWREINPLEGRNNSRCTAHELVISGAEGRPAMKLCVRLTLPDGRRTELWPQLTCASTSTPFAPTTPHPTGRDPSRPPGHARRED